MLPNTEEYVNHGKAHYYLLEYMDKLKNIMNINEYVHFNLDISTLILSPLTETSESEAAVLLELFFFFC